MQGSGGTGQRVKLSNRFEALQDEENEGGVDSVVRMIHDMASLSWRVRTMHLIGKQNTWEQAPGVAATPSPP